MLLIPYLLPFYIIILSLPSTISSSSTYHLLSIIILLSGNPMLLRIMEYIVVLLRQEYLGDSKIKMTPSDHRGE
jgi:hypothetical protein